MPENHEDHYRDKWLEERFIGIDRQYEELKRQQTEARSDFRAAVIDIKAENRNLVAMVQRESQSNFLALNGRLDEFGKRMTAIDARFDGLAQQIGQVSDKASDRHVRTVMWIVGTVLSTALGVLAVMHFGALQG